MMGRVAKFFSKRLYPPVDLAGDDVLFQSVGGGAGHIVLKVKQQRRPGFYMLECHFHSAGLSRIVHLSPLGDVRTLLAAFPLQAERLQKRSIYIPSATEGWQLSMLDDSQQFVSLSKRDCEYLRLVPLRNGFAINRMLRRLQAKASFIKKQAKKRRQPFADALYRMYDRSFIEATNEYYQQWIDYVEIEQLSTTEILSPLKDESAYHFYCAPGYRLNENARTILLEAFAKNPNAQLLYTDEDQIDATGVRKNPQFKPDWNPDLFVAQDYISACYACRQDWYMEHQAVFDRLGSRLALSALLPVMSAEAGAIVHVPRILAHKVTTKTKADADETQQPDWVQRRMAVLREVLPADLQLERGLVDGSLRVRYPVPEPVPLVSLLVPTRDGLSVLKPCVESILEKTSYPNYEILILDNQSEMPETLSWLADIAKAERVRVLPYNKPFNYSAINNFGARQAEGAVIGLINNDVEVISPDWLTEMVSQAMRPEIGCVGAKLYYSNGQIQHAGVILGLGDVAGHAHRFLGRDDEGYHGRLKLVQNYSAVTAACLLVRREIYDAVGGLEEEHLAVAYNDVDFCLRVREAGYRNLWTPYAELYHHESISRGEDDTPVKKARYQKEVAYMQKTWKTQLENDPCYNPNLCRRREDFSLPDVLF